MSDSTTVPTPIKGAIHDYQAYDEEQFIALSELVASPSELDYPLSQEDLQTVQEFEAAWSSFLAKNPSQLPMGKRGHRLNSLRSQIDRTLQAKAAAEAELTQQLAALQTSRNALEESYQKVMAEEKHRQRMAEEKLHRQLDNVAIAEHLGSNIIAFNHFLHSVDQAIIPEEQDDTVRGREVKPSARAMALVDPVGDARDVELRAFRIDHLMLKEEAKYLEREIQGLEKTTDSLEDVGQLLTENNVWSIINKSGE